MCVSTCTLTCVYDVCVVGVKTTLDSQLSPTFIRVLGLNSGHQDCVASTAPRWTTLLAHPNCILKLFFRLFTAVLHFNSFRATGNTVHAPPPSWFAGGWKGLEIKPNTKTMNGKGGSARPRPCSLRVQEIKERRGSRSGQFVAQGRLCKDGPGSSCL